VKLFEIARGAVLYIRHGALFSPIAFARKEKPAMILRNSIDLQRRRLLRTGALALAATQIPGLAQAQVNSIAGAMPFGPLKQVNAGLLNIGYVEVGPAGGAPVVLLHGWPYDIHAFAEAAPLLADKGYRVIIPHLRGHGTTRLLSDGSVRNGQPAALAMDVIALMDALQIKQALLGGFDWGARTADIVAALWPERVKGLVAVSGYLIGSQAAGKVPLPPDQELQWWYQFYFATPRGVAGYDKYRRDFAKLIWKLASPQWAFSDAAFNRSAASLDNPDHVTIVIHNYRWRMGLADGERQYDAIEQKLAAAPMIAVPSITMEGDANGAPHPPAAAYATKFTGKYEHRLITGGIGHNLPQEAPRDFADAMAAVDRL
jgi:pimeloyl-ACP methyl ester carboxylesterase